MTAVSIFYFIIKFTQNFQCPAESLSYWLNVQTEGIQGDSVDFIVQHRNSTIKEDFLTGSLACGSNSCQVFLENFPEVSWNRTGKILSTTIPQFYKDNKDGHFQRLFHIKKIQTTIFPSQVFSQIEWIQWTSVCR